VLGPLKAGHLFLASDRVGKSFKRLQQSWAGEPEPQPAVASPFKIV
jgi:hypothetical protein